MQQTNLAYLAVFFKMCIMDECLHFSANMCVDLSWFLLNYYGKTKKNDREWQEFNQKP